MASSDNTTIRIEKLVYGGEGLARTSEGVVLVAGVLPGETVRIGPGVRSGGVLRSPLVEIVTSSPHRRRPPCLYADSCGGCNLQYADYALQLASKRDVFVETLSRVGRIRQLPDVAVHGSPEWGWRRRVQIKLDHSRCSAGFFKTGSHDVVRIPECKVCTLGINALLSQDDLCARAGDGAEQIRVIEGDNAVLAGDPVIDGCTSSSTVITEGGVSFTVSGSGFFQGNKSLSAQLPTWIAPQISGDLLYDLYGGQGYFSLLAGAGFSRSVLVETSELMVERARRNFVQAGRGDFGAAASSVEEYFRVKRPRADCIIVDPPRVGLSKQVVNAIAYVNASTIVSVSCDPVTQARDLAVLIEKHGYRIDACALFDLYPQTHHMETVVILRKS